MPPSGFASPLRRSPLAPILLLLALPLHAQSELPDIQLIPGPARFDLGPEAEIDLGAGYLFADAGDTRELLEIMGNITDGTEVGLVQPEADNEDWFLVFEFLPVGFVADSDREEIDADALFESIRAATEESNGVRRERGHGELHVKEWFERPHYDEASHNLVWALTAVDETGEAVVNYNQRVLGRRGYTSVTLVASPQDVAALKPQVERLMAGFRYKTGSRYAEFVQGDKLAGYGLAALVAGGAGAAAAKLGLFATLGKALAKGWKLVVVALAALLAGLRRLFGSARRAPAASGGGFDGPGT